MPTSRELLPVGSEYYTVNQNPAAVFAGNDFSVLCNFQLKLWRYFIETSAAGIPLNRNDRKAIAIGGTHFVISADEALFHVCACR